MDDEVEIIEGMLALMRAHFRQRGQHLTVDAIDKFNREIERWKQKE